jgi:hypothetical protein
MRRRRAAIAIGEAGGVAQQVLDGRQLPWRACAAVGLRNLLPGKRRQILRNWIGEQHAPHPEPVRDSLSYVFFRVDPAVALRQES